MKTAYVGKFENNTMIEAKPTRILKERCKNQMKEILVAKPKMNSKLVKFEKATEYRPSGSPTTIDPFEKTTIFVKDVPGKGEALFARRDISANEQIA